VTVGELLARYPQLSELKSPHLDGAARAFVTLSPEYFLSHFGTSYLAQTYWRVFVDRPECFGFVWLDEGRVVGFAGGTAERDRFIGQVIGASPVSFGWRLLLACARTPQIFAQGVGLLMTLVQERRREGPGAELLSLGVLPPARRPVPSASGAVVSPAQVLLAASAARLRERGAPAFRLYTGATNHLACRLYRRLGFHESHRLRLFGEEKVCFVASVDAPGLSL